MEIQRHYRQKARENKERLPSDLPVETVEHFLSEEEQSCPECSSPLHIMGKDIRRELKLIPAKAVIVEHVNYVYACRDCEKNACGVPIVKAPVDKPVIKGSFASPEAVAHIMTQKFANGMPLYRQEQDLQRSGILLSRQTMSNWLIACSESWLEPVYNAMREILREHSVLHVDESVLQVLQEPGRQPRAIAICGCTELAGMLRCPLFCMITNRTGRPNDPWSFCRDLAAIFIRTGTPATIACRTI